MIGLGLPELMLFMIFVFSGIFWLWALIDILRNDFTGSNKLIWILLVLFIPVLGFVLYFLIGRKQKIPTALKK
jgi:ABC-type molybdate transport system permease subunit